MSKFRTIYLDNNSTTCPLPIVQDTVVKAMSEGYGNASSAHSGGDYARDVLRSTREDVLNLLGLEHGEITFTSGGTESNNQVLNSALGPALPKAHIVTTAIEHSSILQTCERLRLLGCKITIVPARRDGVIDLQRLDSAIQELPQLVSVQWVNNETGVIQPIEQVSNLCRMRGVSLHSDAAQAVGKTQLNLDRIRIDHLTFTAHKLHAPQGVGVVWSRQKAAMMSLLHGGSQEGGLRAGTENIPGIAGLGMAARSRQKKFDSVVAHMAKLRDEFEYCVMRRIPDVILNGTRDSRICNTTNLMFCGVDGQALVARLSNEGILCSQSSACTNQRPEPSYVLTSMGLSEEEAYSSIRFSFSELNTRREIEFVVERLAEICTSLRNFKARTGT